MEPTAGSPLTLAPRLLVLAGLAAPAAAQFLPAAALSSDSQQAKGVFAADLDGDQDLDVLSCSAGIDKLVWFENLGGSFGPAQALPNYSDFDAGLSVSAADLDGDGWTDVLVGARDYEPSLGDSYRVSWHRNLDGAGFSLPLPLEFDANLPVSVIAADLDGDGDPDPVWGQNGDGELRWRESHADGSFGAFSQPIGDLGTRTERVVAEDLDGDGDLDLFAASSYQDSIVWFENLGGASFGPMQVISTSADEVRSLEAGDLDGDGDLDLLHAGLPADPNGWLQWHENLGGGSFAAPVTINAPGDTAVWDATLADLDGDGRLDVLVGGVLAVSWHRNQGGGSFGPRQLIDDQAFSTRDVLAADLDGDGDLDALGASAGESRVAWYEQQPAEVGTPYCFGDGSGATCPCSAVSGPGEGCPTTSGQGAVLSGTGVADVGADSVVLHVAGAPPFKPGLLFQGTSVQSAPVGDGLLCTQSQRRHRVHVLDASGSTSYTDLGPAATPGQVLRYQYWFRDAMNPCGGGFNFTNGYAVSW